MRKYFLELFAIGLVDSEGRINTEHMTSYDFHENNGRADKNENGSFSFGNNNGDDLMYV